MVLVAIVLFLRRRKMSTSFGSIAKFVVPMVLTGTGLFFLPFVIGSFPGAQWLTTPAMDWGLFVFGAGAHANPLTWSAIVPLGLTALFLHRQGARPVIAGIAAGASAFLLHALFSAHADVVFLPGRALDVVWLGVNGAVAFLVSWTLVRKEW